MMSARPFYQRERFIYLFAIFASLILSLWIDYRETVINPDAICYLLTAQSVSTGLQQAMHLCGQAHWPFYPMLIYSLVQVSHVSYLAAAYALNAIFTLFSVILFILIIKELGGSRRVLWFAAFVILLSHEFNSVRQYIVRDHGFWAFYLSSFYFLLRYFRSSTWMNALAWNVSLLTATLFRIEGMIFLLALPLLISFYPCFSFKTRFKNLVALNFVTFILCLIMGVWLALHPQETLAKLGRLNEVIHQFQYGFAMIGERYDAVKTGLIQHVLTADAFNEAGLVTVILLFVWYGINIIENVSWIYALFVVYAWRKRVVSFAFRQTWVIAAYLVVNVLVTAVFFLQNLFLSKRYLIALSLILMIWVPFALEKLWQQATHLRSRLITFLAVFFIFVSALGGIFDFGYSKSYIAQAGNWLAEEVPVNATLYVNDYQLMYYSKHFGLTIFAARENYKNINVIAHGNWKKYDYIALRLSKKEEGDIAALLQEIQLIPVKIFSNKRGDKVVIYRTL